MEKIPKLPFAMPNPEDMKQVIEAMKPLTLLLSVFPSIEVKEVERKTLDPKDKTKVLAVKKFVVIYIEKPQKKAQQ
jgi:hypothetical protein